MRRHLPAKIEIWQYFGQGEGDAAVPQRFLHHEPCETISSFWVGHSGGGFLGFYMDLWRCLLTQLVMLISSKRWRKVARAIKSFMFSVSFSPPRHVTLGALGA